MNIIIRQTDGQRLEGTLLAAGKYCLRVAVPGASDVTELRCEYGAWTLETGESVELESMVVESALDLSLFAEEMSCSAKVAGMTYDHC
jgi:hypothetical protein